METTARTVIYDNELQIEAYHFQGILQPFPNHFHEHYVIGLVEEGERCLSCKNRDYTIQKGSILLFNPGDNHACRQSGDARLNYRGLNIPKEVMVHFSEEFTGSRRFPVFSSNVIEDEEIAFYFCRLHRLMMDGSSKFQKEEAFLLLITVLIQTYDKPFAPLPEGMEHYRQAVALSCTYMKEHFSEPICLEELCHHAGLSKSTLLRAFTKIKGVTPYRYLETLRINEAKGLLQQGVPLAEAALRTGFSDQSHFSNYFHRFIGLSPGSYREIFLDKPKTERVHHEEE